MRPIDVVTDQTSAHDPLNGYIPAGLTVEQAEYLRKSDPDELLRARRARAPWRTSARFGSSRSGRRGVRLRQRAARSGREYGDEEAFSYPGFVPAYIRPLFCEGKGPFRWVALSGDPLTSTGPTRRSSTCSAIRRRRSAGSSSPGSACSSRGCRRESAGSATASAIVAGQRFNEMVASGELKGPIVIGRDHLDAGSVASPERETEKMLDGSDAVADWPLLNALINTACGASWVSIHHGGGVGMGKSIHAGQVVVADGLGAGGGACPPRADEPTPGWASSATSTPAMSRRSSLPGSSDLRIPMLDGERVSSAI